MALTTERIIGRQGTLTADGAKTKWQTASITITSNTENATAADSSLDEVVQTTKMVAGTVTGFLGVANNGATLPAVGDTIDDLDFSVASDKVWPSLAAYTNVKVLSVKYDMALGPGTFSFDFRSGVLN